MKTERTVKALLVDDDNNVLALQRGETHPEQGLHWDFPGGFLDGDEEPLDSLLREIKEEIGLDLKSTKLKIVYAMTENIKGGSRVRIIYAGKIDGVKPEIKLSWEHIRYKWLPLEDAIKLMEPTRYKYKVATYLRDNNILQEL